STSFPIRGTITNKDFSYLAIEWLKGINKSTVLDDAVDRQMFDDDARILSKSGELFCLKSIEADTVSAIGLRHEIPDEMGRVWRTECIVSRFKATAWVHVKSQCLISNPDVQQISPKKPFIIKMMIKNGWAIDDGNWPVADTPYALTSSNLDLAERIVSGQELTDLPFVYVSRDDANELIVAPEKLAFQLGGLAHVVVEPTRFFSRKLNVKCQGRNPYGGTVGLCVPSKGLVSKFYIRNELDRGTRIFDAITSAASRYLSSLKGHGALDWNELQELQGRILREKLAKEIRSGNGSDNQALDEYMHTFDADIAAKDAQIVELKRALKASEEAVDALNIHDMGLLNSAISDTVSTELYHGEVSDRVRKLVTNAVAGSTIDLSPRDSFLLKSLLSCSAYTGKSLGLVEQIKSAGRDHTTMAKRLGGLLSDFGFTSSQDGKHLKYIPPKRLGGLKTEILPKTPSDHRAGRNKAADIIDSFSIRDLHKD
ncbi:hypothetical protein, partial [Pseudophaeobacter leonis]|uniref:hypothetical protein n=1 Tax=Pseudophaeobacter leonis TaxID=1144477 RepID=UPI0009F44743